MLVLGIETSGSQASFAVAADGEVIAEVEKPTAMDLSRYIIAWIDETLRQARITTKQLGGIGVSLGPGSWTGLRIGISTAKAMAQGLDVPLVGIPTFEALAQRSLTRWNAGLVIPLALSRRGEVFAGFYRITHEKIKRVGETLALTLKELIEKAQSLEEPAHFCGEGARQYRVDLGQVFPETMSDEPLICHAAVIGQLAAERIRGSETDLRSRESLYAVKPLYLLPSQAERTVGIVMTV